jgi:hypothetical protein
MMFAITVDGRKLPPYLIFKRKKMPNTKLANGVHVCVYKAKIGWMQLWCVTGSAQFAVNDLAHSFSDELCLIGHLREDKKRTLTEIKLI